MQVAAVVRVGDVRVVLAVRGACAGTCHQDHRFHVGVQRQGLRLQGVSQGQEQHELRVLVGGAHHDRQDGDRDHRLGMVKKRRHQVLGPLHDTLSC